MTYKEALANLKLRQKVLDGFQKEILIVTSVETYEKMTEALEFMVEVVRCKDCRHGKSFIMNDMECVACGTHGKLKAPDGFCNCGERKKQ